MLGSPPRWRHGPVGPAGQEHHSIFQAHFRIPVARFCHGGNGNDVLIGAGSYLTQTDGTHIEVHSGDGLLVETIALGSTYWLHASNDAFV
jgi:hypothetical protein